MRIRIYEPDLLRPDHACVSQVRSNVGGPQTESVSGIGESDL